GGADAGFARADVRVQPGGDVVAVHVPVAGQLGVDHRGVFTVRDDRHRRVAEDAVQGVGVVDQHVAGGGAHEDLQTRGRARIDAAYGVQVVVARAHVEAEVGTRAAGGAGVLVFQRFRAQRGWAGIGHVHEAGQPASDGGRRLAGDVGLVFHARLAEMGLVVAHARQQAPAGR